MASYDTIAFSDYDGVTGPPTIDGFIYADAGVNTPEFEPGYVNGGRYSFDTGTLFPVLIQTVKDGNTLVIGLFCRGDRSFDQDFDGLVLALRPQSGSGNLEARRLDIFPVWSDDDTNPAGFGWGADGNLNGTVGHPGAAPNVPSPPGYNYQIRTNYPPKRKQFFRRFNNMGDWSPYSPASGGNASVYDVKVRSWEPPMAVGGTFKEAAWSIEIRVPINTATGGADWIDLQSEFGIYVNLIRAGRTAASGSDAGYYCTQFRFPDFPPAGPNTKLTGDLDLTTNIAPIWYGKGLINPTAAMVQGVRFRPGLSSIGRRPRGNTSALPSNFISRTIDNDLVALLHNSGPAVAGITAEIRFGKWGLGPNGFSAWEHRSGLQRPSPAIGIAAGTNASPAEGTTINQWNASDVAAAGYAENDHRCMWVQLDGAGVNFTQSSLRRNMDFVNFSSVAETAEVSGVGYGNPADGGAEHDFVLSTRCRKIVIRDLQKSPKSIDHETLEIVRAAVTLIPGFGNESGGEGNNTVIGDASTTGGRVALSTALGSTDSPTNIPTELLDYVVYLWITEGYRRTGQFLKIGGKEAEIYDENPGSFGFVAIHKGVDDNLSWKLSGAGLTSYAPGLLGLKVPVEGSTTIGLTVSAEPGGPNGDVSTLPPFRPGQKPGDSDPGVPGNDWRKWPLWVWLILVLLLLILVVLFLK